MRPAVTTSDAGFNALIQQRNDLRFHVILQLRSYTQSLSFQIRLHGQDAFVRDQMAFVTHPI